MYCESIVKIKGVQKVGIGVVYTTLVKLGGVDTPP